MEQWKAGILEQCKKRKKHVLSEYEGIKDKGKRKKSNGVWENECIGEVGKVEVEEKWRWEKGIKN